jgi:hypothetical protein
MVLFINKRFRKIMLYECCAWGLGCGFLDNL